MKKTNILKYAFVSLMAAATFTSCDDLFDEEPIDKLTEESIWREPRLLDSYVAKWYRGLSNGFDVSEGLKSGLVAQRTDQLVSGMKNRSSFNEVVKEAENTWQGYSSEIWALRYGQIQVVNRLYDNADKISSGAQKDRVLAEGHFFKAYYFYDLLRNFGGVPITDKSYFPESENDRLKRATFADMVEYIVSEARTAAENLPKVYSSSDKGRATKGAALMLAAKTYFWAAGQPFQNVSNELYGFSTDKSKEMYSKALEIYKEIKDLGIYKLVPVEGKEQSTISANYADIFLKNFSSESIYEVNHQKVKDQFGHKLDLKSIPPSLGGTKCMFTPTQNHVDEYEMRDGGQVDPANPYEGRDYRFYANIMYDGSTYAEKTLDMTSKEIKNDKGEIELQPGKDIRGYNGISDGYTSTGYYMRKFLNPEQDLSDNDKNCSHQHFIIWRYAELLLDCAEINFRLGNSAEALKDLNEVRERVHMAPLTSATLEDILHERRVELAFEDVIYWDMLRLGTAEKLLNGKTNPIKSMQIVEKLDGTKTYTVVEDYNKEPEVERVFTSRRYFLCIPWENEQYFQKFDNNPGWKNLE